MAISPLSSGLSAAPPDQEGGDGDPQVLGAQPAPRPGGGWQKLEEEEEKKGGREEDGLSPSLSPLTFPAPSKRSLVTHPGGAKPWGQGC